VKKNALIVSIILTLSLIICGCASDEDKAKEMLYTAQLEVEQFADNRAEKLFEAVVKNYPQTKAAKVAIEDLKKLRKRRKLKKKL